MHTRLHSHPIVVALSMLGAGCSDASADRTEDNYRDTQHEAVGSNLVQNPSFESNLEGWKGWQATLKRRAPSDAPHGDYVARVIRKAGTSFTIDDAPETVASSTAGARYEASAKVRAASPSSIGKPVFIRIRERSGESFVQEWSSSAAPLTTSFETVSVTAIAIGSGHTLDVRLSHGAASWGNAFDVDEVTLTHAGGSVSSGSGGAGAGAGGSSSGAGGGASAIPTCKGATWPPYVGASFWNTPIPASPPVRADSAARLARIPIASAQGVLTSDVTQNSYPVYLVDASTAKVSVEVYNYFSYFGSFDTNPDGVRTGAGFNPTIPGVPIPPGVKNGGGDDEQVLFWDPSTGAEWSFWQFAVGGSYVATNGYKYDTLLGTGRMQSSGRGAGVSKLGGLVSACEVEQDGAVEHAVAFSMNPPSPEWVWPATKSDGTGQPGLDLPEGARVQLDPSLTEADFDALGLSKQGKVIARALQKYGLLLVDVSGRAKAFLESDNTGAWSNPSELEYVLAPLTVGQGGSPDWTVRFRVIDWNHWTGGATGIQGP